MKSDKLQAWALIAEIVGGIAVVVTLIFLILETRENNQVMRAATYDAIQADIANLRFNYATDNELQEVDQIISTEGRGVLTPAQVRLESTAVLAIFMNFERAYIQWNAGNLEDSAWERFRRSICSTSGNPAFEETVGIRLDQYSTESFTTYRKTQCQP